MEKYALQNVYCLAIYTIAHDILVNVDRCG